MNPKILMPSPLENSVEPLAVNRKANSNARPLAATDFSEADQKRFWRKAKRGNPDECWNWTASKCIKGYGFFGLGNVVIRAHRVAFIISTGTSPNPLHVLHRCDNPSCVNPSHLFTGTNTDNVRDSVKKGRHCGQSKTHCIKGHPFNASNTIHFRGWRRCRICQQVRAKAWKQKQKLSKLTNP